MLTRCWVFSLTISASSFCCLSSSLSLVFRSMYSAHVGLPHSFHGPLKSNLTSNIYQIFLEVLPIVINFSLNHSQTRAEEEVRKRLRAIDESSSSPPAMAPPCPPSFVPTLLPIVRLFDCDVMILLMKTIIARALVENSVRLLVAISMKSGIPLYHPKL